MPFIALSGKLENLNVSKGLASLTERISRNRKCPARRQPPTQKTTKLEETKMMIRQQLVVAATALALAVAFAAPADAFSKRKFKNVVGGAAIGAGVGALVGGGSSSSVNTGAVVGAIAGAVK